MRQIHPFRICLSLANSDERGLAHASDPVEGSEVFRLTGIVARVPADADESGRGDSADTNEGGCAFVEVFVLQATVGVALADTDERRLALVEALWVLLVGFADAHESGREKE